MNTLPAATNPRASALREELHSHCFACSPANEHGLGVSFCVDGTFHEDPTGVEHHGFKRDWMLNALWDAGFKMVEICTAHTIVKPAASGGEPRSYPVFFMAARVRPER